MTLGTGEDREQDGRPWAGWPAAQKHPIFSANRLMTQSPFADIIINRQSAILGVAAKRLPLVADVPDSFRECTLGQRPLLELGDARADAVKHRFGFTSTDLTAPIGRQFAGSFFDVVQLPDPLQDLVCIAW